jgi:galactokinase
VVSAARSLIEAFEERFRKTPDIYRAPGRVNLIGEHTDYNLGYVLPIAIDLACYTASAPNRDGVLRVYSRNLKEGREWRVPTLSSLRPAEDWTDYVIGVARGLGLTRGGDVMIESTVPLGAGLSSSAALEVSCALALGWPADAPGLDLVKLCHRAESDFVGLPCGVMDQYVSVFGKAHAAVQIDCRNLENELVPLPPVAVIAVNSMVRHELAQSAYRERVAECALAVETISRQDRPAQSLRDVNIDQVARIPDPVIRRRARHVVTENQRVLDFVAASKRCDLAEMGRILVESHRSLRDDYEVSCPELDFLVDTAVALPRVWGARMTGGGFGGCTVNLVDAAAADSFVADIAASYRKRFGVDVEAYRVEASAGATRIS